MAMMRDMAIREHHQGQTEARNEFGAVISRARYAGEPTVLINRNRESAVVISYALYEKAMAALGHDRVVIGKES
jgi:prevent-host-death family protein